MNYRTIIILLFIIVILLIGTGFLLYNYLQPKPVFTPVNQPVNLPIVINENVNQDNQSWLGIYDGDDKLIKQAILETDTKYCNEAKGNKNTCLYYVAISMGKDICQQISDQTIQTKCLQYHAHVKALAEKDLNGCLVLSDQEFRASCLTQLYIQQNDPVYCQNLPANDKTLCEDLVKKNTAIANKDQGACDNVSDPNIKADCQNIVVNLPPDSDQDGIADSAERLYGLNPFKADTDDDGLSDYDEINKYKTDPGNPDTDADGYKDGEEVSSGHDPLKK